MPKRIPTPPPGDDEPRYLTVVHPYAISGTCNMELPKDRQDFARWVACCINKDAFFAIFHKPSSRGMVIVEILRDYAHFDRFLGEHRWSEFLHNPTEEEKGRVTQVFYCAYNTGRIVQKNGWKRIDVDEAWFKEWSPKNRQIKSPYPQTHFCDVPVEDRTNHALCRPLPGAVKTPLPEVIVAPQPVVGSAAWIQSKKGGSAPAPAITQSKPNPPGAWGKGAPKVHATSAKPSPTANGSVKKTGGFTQGPLASARLPAVGGGHIAIKSNNVWQNTGKKSAPAPVAEHWDDPEPVSGQDTPVSRAISPATAHESAWQGGPPSLVFPGKTAVPGADRAGNVSAASWDSAGASTSSPDSDSGPDLTPATESDNPYAVHIHFSESMEEEFHGMGIRAIEDDGELGELDAIAPGVWDDPAAMATWETTDTPGWDDDPLDAEDQWRQTQAPKPMLCKAHGIICKKGICAEYAKQLRLAKRAEEAEQRNAAMAAKGKKGRTKGRGGKKNDESEPSARNVAQNSQFRGPGAPVKTNWRGAPRAIVSADVIEMRDTTKAASDDGWGNSDSEVEPNVAGATTVGAVEAASNTSWGISEDAYDPWASNAAQPVAKAGGKPPGNGKTAGNGKPVGKKKPAQTPVLASWADQVDAELAAGGDAGTFSVASSKRGKRGTSTTSRGTSVAKSSASGWGSVAEMPW